MKHLKYIALSLMVMLCSHVNGQSKFEGCADLTALKAAHSDNSNSGLSSDMQAISRAATIIATSQDAQADEAYFTELALAIDPASEQLDKYFEEANINELKQLFFLRQLAKGDTSRIYGSGIDSAENKDFSYKVSAANYKILGDILMQCSDALKERSLGYMTSIRQDPVNEALWAIRPIIEKHVAQGDTKTNILSRMDECADMVRGNIAPDISLPDRDGEIHSLSQYRGKYVVIDMWATWCGGCVANIGNFCKIAQSYADDARIQFLIISVDGDRNRWKFSHPRYKLMEMTSLLDSDGEQMYSKYKFTGVPRYIMVDPEGKIISIAMPSPHTASLENFIKEELAKNAN